MRARPVSLGDWAEQTDSVAANNCKLGALAMTIWYLGHELTFWAELSRIAHPAPCRVSWGWRPPEACLLLGWEPGAVAGAGVT